jgi:hypothetical protein
MGIVEAHEPATSRIVKRERISKAVRLREAGVDPPDLELQPVSFFQVVNAAVERQEEFEGMIVRHFYIL